MEERGHADGNATKLRLTAIPLVLAAFVAGGSVASVVFFAHPFSPAFWRRFDEFWGFLWLWWRATVCAVVWAPFVGASLLVQRPRVGDVAVPKLLLIGSLGGFVTFMAVALFANVLGFATLTWLALGAALSVTLNAALFSRLASRCSSRLGPETKG